MDNIEALSNLFFRHAIPIKTTLNPIKGRESNVVDTEGPLEVVGRGWSNLPGSDASVGLQHWCCSLHGQRYSCSDRAVAVADDRRVFHPG